METREEPRNSSTSLQEGAVVPERAGRWPHAFRFTFTHAAIVPWDRSCFRVSSLLYSAC